MKGKIFTCIAAAILLSTSAFTSCSSDSSNDIIGNNPSEVANTTEAPFNLVIKTLNADGKDISIDGDVNAATLFVFNKNNDFVKQINLDKATLLNNTTIQIECPNTDKLTVIAWGGLSSNEEITTMSQARIINDLQIQLKQNNGIAATPSDLFYGQVTISRSSTKAGNTELNLQRKISSINLTTKGLVAHFATTKGNYVYKIKNSKDGFNYNGEVIGNDVDFLIPATFDKNGVLVTETTPVLPSQNITIELYKDDQLLFSAKNDQNGKNASTIAGKQINYLFNFSGTSTQTASNITVSNWNSDIQYVTLN